MDNEETVDVSFRVAKLGDGLYTISVTSTVDGLDACFTEEFFEGVQGVLRANTN